jgi:hypothetical protein
MKTLMQVAIVAAVMILLSNAGYAVGQTPAATSTPMHKYLPMMLADNEPAVDAAVSPGAGPETSAEPISRAHHNKGMAKTHETATSPTAHDAELQMTVPNTGIQATAASQAMPSGQAVSAAYAPSKTNFENAKLSYEELNKRIEALSREAATLREELNRQKTQEHAAK